MKSLRTGLSWSFGATLFIGAVLQTGALHGSQAPGQAAASGKKAVPKAKAPVKALPPSGGKSPVTGTPSSGKSTGIAPDEFADAYPSAGGVPAADLALTEEGGRKAEALAAFARGVVAEDNAENEISLESYRRTLALDPGYAELAVKVAYELARKNDAPGGIQVLKDAVKAAPKDPRPLVYLAQLYAKHLKKSDVALRYAEQAIVLEPTQFAGYQALFDLFVAAGDTAKAEEVIARAEGVRSDDARFWVQLGDLATRLYLKEDGSADPAHQAKMNGFFAKGAQLAPTDASIQAKVGDYFVLSRQVKEAIPYYLSALERDSDSDDPAVANLREKLARAFVITDEKDRAIQMLESVVAEHPMRFETYELLGELYRQKGDVDKSIANFEQTLLIDGSNVESYVRLGRMYLEMRRPDKAVDAMRQARSKFPDVPQVAISLAVTLSTANRHGEAIACFAEILADAEQNHREVLDAEFYYRYGAAAERAGMIDRAAELLQESIRLDPANAAEARNFLGYMWVDRDMHLDEAGELIKKALEQDPDNGAYIDSLGWYYYKKGDPERALKELHRALENLKGEDPEIFRHIGDAYQALGKPVDAMGYWQKALALEPSDELRDKIEALKQKLTKRDGTPAPEAK